MTPQTRRRIERAVRHGLVVSDPDEAAVAAELAIRRLRALRWQVILKVGIGLFALGALSVAQPSHPSGSYWLFMASWGIYVPAVLLLARWHGRRVARAYRVNRSLSEGREQV